MYTQRSDWFTALLENVPHLFVSGSGQHSERLVSGSTITLRMMGHFPPDVVPPLDPAERAKWLPPYYELMTFFVCVELPTQIHVNTFRLAGEPKLSTFFEWFEKHIESPVSLLVFAGGSSEGVAGHFWIVDRKASLGGSLVAPKDYAVTLNKLRHPSTAEEPVSVKPINRSINDVFQWWTRSYLTKQLSINDVDAISFNSKGKTVIIELKRSSQKHWLPYLADVPNYMLLKALVRKIKGSIDLTIRYDLLYPFSADCFSITAITRDLISGGRISLKRSPDTTESLEALTTVIAEWPELALTDYRSPPF